MMEDAAEGLTPRCSRAECGSPAAFRINWRNPRIHTSGRTKVWLACPEHLDYLYGFLQSRDFPVAVDPLEQAAPASDAHGGMV